MKKGFNFEANLPHQENAVNSLMGVFEDCNVIKSDSEYSNDVINFEDYIVKKNVSNIQNINDIEGNFKSDERIFDIHMETGTGKTYTYTKSIFEMNKKLGIFKFIIVVPSLAIKAGTVSFLKSKSTKDHFRGLYGKDMNIHVVDSKENKGKKNYMPSSISEFVRTNNMSKNIQILVINSHMITSKTMTKRFDINLFDKYNTPLGGIKACKPITIIDEPHRFQDNKTFKELLKFNSQFIVRYGATFKDNKYENLLYYLNSLEAFKQDLVKGITTHIPAFKDGENVYITLRDMSDNEVTFELNDNDKKSKVKLIEGQSLANVHNAIEHLEIEKVSKTKIVLSDGLEMKKGDKINPYSYSGTVQSLMLKEAIKKHFEIEKDLLTRDVKIKPLTLFFIDDIESYRDTKTLAIEVESLIKAEVEKLLKNETNEFYKNYLEKTLSNLGESHGGYFSKDNSLKDEKIEKEINEIIHDKEALLDTDNIRRFIFSKWTLKEGWDNPNVFQICKLRTSGSETSKLQEVGRGLRIPVNEYMERVKDENFHLHYYVDFTERAFVANLQQEINSDVLVKYNEDKLEDSLISKICKDYSIDDNELLGKLISESIIEYNKDFKENGMNLLKELYPLSFEKLNKNKVRSADQKDQKVSIRKENYKLLESLWENLNRKVILEYNFKDEEHVYSILYACLKEKNLYENQFVMNEYVMESNNDSVVIRENQSINSSKVSIINLKYSEFIKELSSKINVNINTIHRVFFDLKKNNILDINNYLNYETIRIIVGLYKTYLIENVHDKFEVKFNEVNNKIHPTAFTNSDGSVKDNLKAENVGVNYSEGLTDEKYLFDELFYDSELEKENIKNKIKEVVVFTKIPKNSIKIPFVFGTSYSPDFAYVVKYENGQKELNLIIETKGKEEQVLSSDEKNKITLAEKLFANADYNVKFKKQLSNKKIVDIIKEVVE